MIIFTNLVINPTVVNYNQWETCNGDYISISRVGESYIERCIDLLEQYIGEYPKHINYLVWKQYQRRFEKELEQRATEQYISEFNLQPKQIMLGA